MRRIEISNKDNKIKELPNHCGVYIMKDEKNNVLYVGKAKSLRERVSSYFSLSNLSLKNVALISNVKRIDYLITSNEQEALLLENELIKYFHPKYNVEYRDDKSYPFLKLTKEAFPRLILIRKKTEDGSQYFGPYPDGLAVRRVLGIINRIFPLRKCSRIPKQVCLYYHLNQCLAPCINKTINQEYKEVVQDVSLFLEGKHKELVDKLTTQMEEAASKLNFEKAKQIRDEIEAIKNFSKKINFRLVQDRKQLFLHPPEVLTCLKKILNLPTTPFRIDAFDISNIAGEQAVGSMVVFINGKPEKSEYRKYKIKMVKGINDVKMMREVIQRRYKKVIKENLYLPDLILVDGGIGQLNAALEELSSLNLKIPVIGLAKREELIYQPGQSVPLRLPRDSAELKLIQHIRDEAHRFAITFHRNKRGQATFLQ